jgi:run domain Beclin-1 interacting cysteine-rich containing protein
MDFTDHHVDDLNPSVKSGEVVCTDDNVTLENEEAGNLKVEADPFSDTTNQLCSRTAEYSENASAEFIVDQKLNSTQSMLENNMKKASENAPGSVIPYKDHPAVVKVCLQRLLSDYFLHGFASLLLVY